MSATNGRLQRTRLWALFDRLAVALLCGAIVNLVLMCPPQHGKSQYWSKYFPAWYLSHLPQHRIILASYAAGYATGWGRQARDVIVNHGLEIKDPALAMPRPLDVREDVSGASEWQLDGHEGGMVTSGYEGGIAGRAAELAIVDDPIKDAAIAASRAEKEKIWAWWEEELSARLQKGGRRVMLMTRRAVDDPIGRILKLHEQGKEKWTIIRLPAIAEEDENWPEWKWSRKAGEPLAAELHPLAELEGVKGARGNHVWAGLYQQRPYPRGGGDFKGEWFKIVDADPAASLKVRAWDLAYSESETAKRTAGVLMTKRRDGGVNKYHIENIVYGRWGSGRRNEKIVQQAKIDGKGVPIVFEEEGGSGGPTQVDELVRLLDGYRVIRSRAGTGAKELRADPMASQAEVGNFTIRSAAWNADFVSEMDAFPKGPTIDMVDAAAHAYNWLAAQDDGPDVSSSFDPAATVPQGQIFRPVGRIF